MKPRLWKHVRSAITLGALTVLALALAVQVAGATAFTGSVSGRVTDTKGNPVQGITVEPWVQSETSPAWNGAGGPTIVTDANGAYTIKFDANLNNAASRNCTILFDERRQLISDDKYMRDTWWKDIDGTEGTIVPIATQAANATHFTLNNGAALTGFDAKMKVRRAKISGMIVNRAGTPLPNMFVQAYGKSFASQTAHGGDSMTTGTDGKYELWVDPHLEDATWWSILAVPSNSNAYFGRWYANTLVSQTLPYYVHSTDAAIYKFVPNSDEQLVGKDISLTENRPDVLTFTYAKPKAKRSKTLIAAGKLNPVHDPTIKITAKIYKYNSRTKKYVYKSTATVKQTASGLVTKWSISKKVSSKGKYKVKVSVGKHLWGLHRATSASKIATIK